MRAVRTRELAAFLVLTTPLLWAAPGVAQPSDCEVYKPVEALATSNAFSKVQANTLEELQRLFVELRGDIETALAESGWNGRPQDLFQAIAQGSGVEEVRVGRGEQFHWMAFRQDNEPEVRKCVVWRGMQTFEAWKVEVASNGSLSTLYIPKICLNISLFRQVVRPKESRPVCRLNVTRDCSSRSFTVSAAGSSDDVVVEVVDPDRRRQTLDPSRATRPLTWSYDYDHNYGSYRFLVSGDRGTSYQGESLRCSEEAEIETCAEPLSCQLTLSATEVVAGEPFMADATVSGPVPDPHIESVTLEVESEKGSPPPPRQLSPPYSTTEQLDKAGTYTYRVTAQGGTEGPATCEASIVIKPAHPRFTVRGFGSILDPSGDPVSQELTGSVLAAAVGGQGTSIQRRKYDIGRGQGFGLGLEYHVNRRIGVEVGALFAETDLGFVVDTETQWERVEDKPDVTILSAGVNFHLTPGRKVDVFVGPLIGRADYGDAELPALGQSFDQDFEGDTVVGINLGIEVPACGKRCVSFYGGLRYLESSAESDDNAPQFEIGVDPLILNVGVAYHF